MKIVPFDDPQHPRSRRRERVLRAVSLAPSLATLGNLVCGLGAIYMCMLSIQAGDKDFSKLPMGSVRLNDLFPTYLAIGAYLVAAAMFFDALDGRLARWARKTSEFGAQLDSLADVVSFGVAPALLVLCIAQPADRSALTDWERLWWRAEWVMAAIYVCCAALRLARFNVENVEDESAHMGFRGLPTPGAAAAMIGLVILHEDLLKYYMRGWNWTLGLVATLLPWFALGLGLLMVSRFRYSHMVNALLRGRRPFRQVVGLVIVLLMGLVVQFQLTIALAATAYALSGPILRLLRKPGASPTELVTPVAQAPTDWDDDVETFADGIDEEAPGLPNPDQFVLPPDSRTPSGGQC